MEGVTQEEEWNLVVNHSRESVETEGNGNEDNNNNKKSKKRKRKRKKKNRHRSDSADSTSNMSVDSDMTNDVEEPPRKRKAIEAKAPPTEDNGKAHGNQNSNGKHHKGKDNNGASSKAASLKSPPPGNSTSTSTKYRPRPSSLLAINEEEDDDDNSNTMRPPPTSFQQKHQSKPAAKKSNKKSRQVEDPLQNHHQQFATATEFEDDPNLDMLLQQTEPPTFISFDYNFHKLFRFLAWAYVAMALVVIAYGYITTNGATAILTLTTLSSKCFRNNVHTRAKYQGHCGVESHGVDPTTFMECPPRGLCWGGKLQDCRFGGSTSSSLSNATHFFEVSHNRQQCQLTQKARASVEGIVAAVETSTMAHDCGVANKDDTTVTFAEPVWWDVSADKEHPRPLFVLSDVLQLVTTDALLIAEHDDALELVRSVATDHNLFLSFMPKVGRPSPWLGGRTILYPSNPNANNNKVKAGTPLVGLDNHLSWRNQWVPLSFQCYSNGMLMPSPKNEKDFSFDQKKSTNEQEQNSSIVPATNKEKGQEVRLLKNDTKVKTAKNETKVKPAKNETKVKTAKIDINHHRIKDVLVKTKDKIVSSIHKRGMMAKTALASYMNTTRNQSTGMGPKQEHGSDLHMLWALCDIYFLVSLVGFVAIVYIQYQQKKNETYQSWMPEIARLRELALERIEEATNGGYVLTHLRDAVLRAVTASEQEEDEAEPAQRRNRADQQHLQRHIWPQVVEQLKNDPQVYESTVISKTTGEAQKVFSWKKFVESTPAANASTTGGDSGETATSPRRQSPRRVTIQG